jgi:hypothetical protein
MPVRRKTVSLSKNTLVAMFRAIAEILDEDTELAEKLRSELMKRIKIQQKTHVEIVGFFDKATSPDDIRKQLDAKTLEELVSVVNGYSLDPTKTIRKLTDKQRIIEFIIDRRNGLLNRYQGF